VLPGSNLPPPTHPFDFPYPLNSLCPLYFLLPQYNGLFELNGHLHRGNTEARTTQKPFRALRHSALPRSIPPVRCTLLHAQDTTPFFPSTVMH
jgi:hypothetical protein